MSEASKEEIREIVLETLKEAETMRRADVKEVVREAVQETLLMLGVDAKDPLVMQQDMHFVRELRTASEKVRSRGLLALIGVLVVALAGAAWVGIKQAIGAPG